MNSQISDSDTIQGLIKERVDAIKQQDVEKAIAHYSKDLLLFDLVGELSNSGSQSAKNRLSEWFSTMQELLNYEIKMIEITAGSDVAFCNSFHHIVAIRKNGEKLDMWWRETLGWKKQDGNWVIISAHSSVPFDGVSTQASLLLKPPA